MLSGRYGLLDVRFADGGPAILRQADGSGFAYYSSGRKAICINASGKDMKGEARRFSVVIHDDAPKSPILGVFDEWGLGYADGQKNPGDEHEPRVTICKDSIMISDPTGKSSVVSRAKRLGGVCDASAADIVLRVNPCLTLRHTQGRSSLDFQCESVRHSFMVGELQGDELPGMPKPQACELGAATARHLGDTHAKLTGVRDNLKAFKVDSSQAGTKPTFTVDSTSMKDVMDNLSSLMEKLQHPNLAPASLEWDTELRLKKALSSAHPACPTQSHPKFGKWSIARFGGKCTAERLANAKPMAQHPKPVPMISQFRLPELIEELSTKSTLLVVICLASYCLEQSTYAKLLGDLSHTELLRRYGAKSDGSEMPFKFVAVELAEERGFTEKYGITEVPHCLMFQSGHSVYSKRMSGMKVSLRDTCTAKPHILLVESNPAQQMKVERQIRRAGYMSDLALDGSHALQLASRQKHYGIVLINMTLKADVLRNIVAAVKRHLSTALAFGFNGDALPDEEPEARLRIEEEFAHVFPHLPGYQGLMCVFGRYEAARPTYKHAGHDKNDFAAEVLGVLDGGSRGGASMPAAVAAGGGQN